MTPTEPSFKPPFAITLIGIALAVLVLLAGAFLFRPHRQAASPANPTTSESYAPSLVITGVKTSQTTSTAGARIVSLQGHIANHGPATVTEITVTVVFDNDNDADPESHTLPINAAPLAPHTNREFRLDFQNIGENWNQQQPEIQIADVQTR